MVLMKCVGLFWFHSDKNCICIHTSIFILNFLKNLPGTFLYVYVCLYVVRGESILFLVALRREVCTTSLICFYQLILEILIENVKYMLPYQMHAIDVSPIL